jgi:hypothetical protein
MVSKWNYIANMFRGLCGSKESQDESKKPKRANSVYNFSTSNATTPSPSTRSRAVSTEKEAEWKKEIGSVVVSTIVEGVKIAMATLLSVFVPQYCEREPPLENGTCDLKENFSNLTQFNSFVVVWNFITLGLFIHLSYIINKREAYFIQHLDVSKDHSDNSFETNCASRPRIILRVKEFNKRIMSSIKYTLGFFVCNILFSCILIFYYFYDGFRSVTTLLGNVLLVSNKLYSLHEIGSECTNGAYVLALSTVKQEPTSYNVLDEAYAPPRKTERRNSLSTITEGTSSQEQDSKEVNDHKNVENVEQPEVVIELQSPSQI